MLAGDMVCPANETQSRAQCQQAAGLFQVEGRLYLIDGQDIVFLSRTDGARWAMCLYGRDWTHAGGPVHEPVNQLSNIRIISVVESSTSVPTGIAAESVVQPHYRRNRKQANFGLNGDMLKLDTTCALNTEIEVCLHIGGSYNERGELSACSGTAVFGGKYDNSVYCFGGNDRSRVFRSKYVGAADLARSRFHVPGSMGLYFPVGYDFSVAAGSACVRAICRHYDRLLLFTADDARMTDLSESSYQDLPVRPVNSGVGCLSAGGVVLCDNDPMTVSRDGIYRWTSNTDERDESNAKRISEQLAGLLGRDFGAGALAFNYREADEIWIANPADPEGRVFVYNYRLEKWYCHTGISAEHFFRFGGRLGFCRAGDVFMFGEEEYTDCGAEIVAEYESRYTDMGQAGLKKRVKRVLVVSSAESDSVELHNTGRNCASSFEGRPGRGLRAGGPAPAETTYVKYCLRRARPAADIRYCGYG